MDINLPVEIYQFAISQEFAGVTVLPYLAIESSSDCQAHWLLT